MTTLTGKTTEILDKAKSLFGKQVQAIIRQEHKAVELIQNVGKKLAKLADHPKVKLITTPISIFVRMIKAHVTGGHKIAVSTLGMIVLALVYFLSPIDLVPDFLGFFGFADDISVVLAVYAKVKDEVERFLEWERTQI
ncbi:DUF1232 domain-containing protein [Algoriphagus lacus]|uniref:DUF1232 domain-containing protein n=1 Tax=Algoriphagus lacus TaxID=2056311 RepID=A0A418PRD2_9BACT|nr:DUF1232 domain-containing protein [Algoriphagus lacus]RIW15190.1 DUF1232 domain-containing protein [Algoriphagus lacus]